MEISKPEYREHVISNCCSCGIYEDTDECSDCLEHCSFILKEPTAFHKYLIFNSEDKENPVLFLMELMRGMLVNDQNQMVFELMDIVDIGEKTYNSQTLERVANMLLETKHTTKKMDDIKLLIKQKKENGIN